MTLNKAIEIKVQWRKANYPPPLADEMNADKLSIEALKWRQLMEHDYGSWCGPLLPGETEE